MKDRLKELRRALNLTQQKFADKLGVKQNTVAQYEMGRNDPSDAVIISICREFNVSEAWLRNGEGEMFIPMTLDEEIASFIGGIQADIEPTFKKRFVSALAKLSPEEWKTIEHIMRNMIDEREKEEVKE
jgi:bacteriophage CI repressor helix-turn-helix domain